MSKDEGKIISFPHKDDPPPFKRRVDLTPPIDEREVAGRRSSFRVVKGGKSS